MIGGTQLAPELFKLELVQDNWEQFKSQRQKKYAAENQELFLLIESAMRMEVFVIVSIYLSLLYSYVIEMMNHL